MLTVNDLIGLDYSNLRNPQPADMGPGLSYQVDPAAQGGRRLVSDIKPALDRGLNSIFGPSNLMPDPNYPEFAQVNMGATGTIPTAAKLNAQPLIGETSGIAPLLTSDTNMPLDYEEMIKKDSSIVTPPKKKIGLENILQLALSAAIPGVGFLMRAPKGLAGLNRRFRKNLDNFFDRRKYDGRTRDQAYANMITQTRGIQKKIDSGVYDDKGSGGIDDRGRGSMPSRSTSSAPSKSRSSGGYGGGRDRGRGDRF